MPPRFAFYGRVSTEDQQDPCQGSHAGRSGRELARGADVSRLHRGRRLDPRSGHAGRGEAARCRHRRPTSIRGVTSANPFAEPRVKPGSVARQSQSRFFLDCRTLVSRVEGSCDHDLGESGIVRRAPKDGSGLAGLIRAYMRTHGIETLGEMADILDVDRTLVSKYVNGARLCHDVTQLRRFAEAMDVSPESLGLMPEPDHAFIAAGPANEAASEWQLVRRKMNRNRSRLTKMVADLYWDPVRIEGTTCITLPDWMPPSPVDLSAIELSWKQDAVPPEVNGQEAEAAAYRAAGPEGEPYRRYSQAISALARPALFDNRGSYRLLDLAWDAGGGRMSFGYTTSLTEQNRKTWRTCTKD